MSGIQTHIVESCLTQQACHVSNKPVVYENSSSIW